MSCKLRCPKCWKLLKNEEDGPTKGVMGEYRAFAIYYPLPERKYIACIPCGHVGAPTEFGE